MTQLSGNAVEHWLREVSGDSAITVQDQNRMIVATATGGVDLTITIPSAGSVPNGFHVYVRRDPSSTKDVVVGAPASVTLTASSPTVELFHGSSGYQVVQSGTGSGSGDVTGPASAVVDNFASFASTSGKVIADSGYSATSFATATHVHTSYSPLTHVHTTYAGTTHADTHQYGSSDPVAQTIAAAFKIPFATASSTLDTSWLPVSTVPTASKIPLATASSQISSSWLPSGTTASTSIPGDSASSGSAPSFSLSDHKHARESFGTSAGNVVEGNDSRLSDARTPLAHASTHTVGASDALSPASVGARPLHGFESPTSSTLSMGTSSDLILTPSTSSPSVVWIAGARVSLSSAASVVIPDDYSLNYVTIDTGGNLQVSTDPADLVPYTRSSVATVYKAGSDHAICDERHFSTRDFLLQAWARSSLGAQWISGLLPVFNHTTFTIQQGTWALEDRTFDTGGSLTTSRQWNRIFGTVQFTENVTAPWKAGGSGQPQYDSGTLTDVSAGYYFNSWFYVAADVSYPIYQVVAQAQYATLAEVRTETLPVLPIPTTGWRLLARATYRESSGSAAFVEYTDYRSLGSSSTPQSHASLQGRGSYDQHPASAITFSATGGISGTTAQAAIAELDTEKISIPSSSATGDLLYHNGTSYTRLAAGTAGYFLKTAGTTAAPSWVPDNAVDAAALSAYLDEPQSSQNLKIAAEPPLWMLLMLS